MINQQANTIESLDRSICALLLKEEVDKGRPELEFKKAAKGVVAKEIISWFVASADIKVKDRN